MKDQPISVDGVMISRHAIPTLSVSGPCPAERNFGNPCLFPDERRLVESCGGSCCTAEMCNISAALPGYPGRRIPQETIEGALHRLVELQMMKHDSNTDTVGIRMIAGKMFVLK